MKIVNWSWEKREKKETKEASSSSAAVKLQFMKKIITVFLYVLGRFLFKCTEGL